jgi:putative MATE family efflux protein
VSAAPAFDARTRALIEGPILPLLLRLAWPNVLVMLAQASTGLIETYWVGKLGTDALAGMALVFPGVMFMQMLSGGALGGGISSAIARALGSGRRHDADALVLHALVINAAIGACFSLALLLFGRPFYRALGGEGASLEAALAYSNVVFSGMPLLFGMNALASVVRGTGNMLVPALVTCIGVAMLLPLSPLLIFGWGLVPGLGVAGGGFALLAFYAAGFAALAWYLLAGRSVVRPRRARLRWALSKDILRVGAVAAISSVQTNVVIGGATALVGLQAGPAALAGFGTAARLEYLMVSLVFGIGAPLVAMVGTNIGAGQRERALKVAWCGCALAFIVTETIGVAAAIWPRAWLGLFGQDPAMLEAGAVYLRIVGPAFGFFGIGLSLYFASQGAGRLLWPLLGGFLRMIVALGAGWIAMRLTGRLEALYAGLALGLAVYGVTVATAVWRGVWFEPPEPEIPATPSLKAGPARA